MKTHEAMSMSKLEADKLMKAWGFEFEKYGTHGHAIWRHPENQNRRVQLSNGSTSAMITETMMRKAADIVSVSLTDFKQGPPDKPKAIGPTAPFVPEPPSAEPAPQPDLAAADTNGHTEPNGNGNGNGHQPETEEVEPERGRVGHPRRDGVWRPPSERILEYLTRRPGTEIKVFRLCSELGMKSPNVSQALVTVMKNHPEVQKVRRGAYMYTPASPVTVTQAQAHPVIDPAKSPEELADERMEAMRTYKRVHTDGHGRIVLRDKDGDLWIAVKVAPDFFPLTPIGENHNGNGNSH